MKSIFLSSTFRDMEIERDNLMVEVLPTLDEYAKNYGEMFHFIDLRWGVNTEDLEDIEKDEKVISVCLDAIDLSNPYMIVFIGERYGWVPPQERLLSVSKEKEYEIKDYSNSITNLEIEYGALSSMAQLDKCLFYFRKELDVPKEFEKYYKEANSENTKKLNALKQQILDKGAFVRQYTCEWDYDKNCQKLPETFAKTLIDDIKQIFDRELHISREMSWQECAYNIHKTNTAKNESIFAARDNDLSECQSLLLEKPHRVFFVKGEEGCGKSVLLSKLEKELSKTCNTLYFACGNSKFSKSGGSIARQIVYKFEELLGIVHEDTLYEAEFEMPTKFCKEENLKRLIKRHTQSYGMGSEKRLFIFCDEAQYSANEKNNYWHVTSNILSFIPDILHDLVTFVVAVRPDFRIYKTKSKFGKYGNEIVLEFNDFTYNLGALTNEDKLEIINKFQERNSKQLPPRVVDKIASTKNTDNAKYLSILLQRLMMINHDDFIEIEKFGQGIEGINKFLENIIDTAPADVSDLSISLIDKAAERINKTLCSEVVGLIAAAKNGLNERELEAICKENAVKWHVADFYNLLKYMNSFFIYTHNSRIQFKTQELKEQFATVQNLNSYYHKLLRYIDSLPESESEQKVDIVYYLYKMGDEKALVKLLAAKSANKLSSGVEEELYNGKTGAVEELCIIATYDKNWVISFFNNAVQNGATLDFAYNIVNIFYHFFMVTPLLQEHVHVDVAHAYLKMVDDLCEKTIAAANTALPEKYGSFRRISIDKIYLKKLRNLIKIYEELESNFLAGFILLEKERVYTVQICKQILKLRTIIAGIKKGKRTIKDVYLAYSGLFTAYDMMEDRENALQTLLDGLKFVDETAVENPDIYCETEIYCYIADEYVQQKQCDKAYEFYCKNYEEEKKRIFGKSNYTKEDMKNSSALLFYRYHFAKQCIKCKKSDIALKEIEEALEVVDYLSQKSSSNKGEAEIEKYTYYEYFGEVLMQEELKQYEKALECFEKHEEALKKHCQKEELELNLFKNLSNMCDVHEKKGDIKRAIQMKADSIIAMKILLEKTHDNSLYDELCMGYDKLIELYRQDKNEEKVKSTQKEYDEFVKEAEEIYAY